MKLRRTIIFVIALVICSTLSGVLAAPPSFIGTITGNMTLNVPADFGDIQAALDYLNDKRIAGNAIVTIQVADGIYNYTSTIEVKHSEGGQIQILGNVSNPNNCLLNFSGCNQGFLIQNGNKIGLIDGFKLYGNGTVQEGVYVTRGSYAKCGANLIVDNFERGIFVHYNSYAMVTSTAINNSYAGIAAEYDSSIYAMYAVATGNNRGFWANRCSTINAVGVVSSGNTTNFSPSANTEGNISSYIRN
jgi:hypothetical protein